ncbi:Mov34/MPN/PAD-1 family protein [Sphingomonas sp. SUN019]|uniref:Mov34/MPN/PAD-1 family protein n=1 Tax=Sphingomonas sp. SUN019 TaxID=2937788 RepID=UPI0038D47410
MRLEISIADHDAIAAFARGSSEEICGLLIGREGNIETLVPCKNVAADPARFFEIDPATLIAAHRAARAGGPSVIGHYHSHPSGVTTPSARDAADAAPDGAIWIITDGRTLAAWRAGRDGAVHGRFDPVELIRA